MSYFFCKLAGLLEEYLGINPKKEKVMVDSNYNIAYVFDDETNKAVDMDGAEVTDFSTYEKYFLNIDNGMIDAAIIPESFMEYCASLELYYEDLEHILSEDKMNAYENRICYCADASGNTYAAGIYMDGTVFDPAFFAADKGEKMVQALGRQILVFPKTAKNKTYREKTADVLLNIEE